MQHRQTTLNPVNWLTLERAALEGEQSATVSGCSWLEPLIGVKNYSQSYTIVTNELQVFTKKTNKQNSYCVLLAFEGIPSL